MHPLVDSFDSYTYLFISLKQIKKTSKQDECVEHNYIRQN